MRTRPKSPTEASRPFDATAATPTPTRSRAMAAQIPSETVCQVTI
jgi:hypothetical protein